MAFLGVGGTLDQFGRGWDAFDDAVDDLFSPPKSNSLPWEAVIRHNQEIREHQMIARDHVATAMTAALAAFSSGLTESESPKEATEADDRQLRLPV